MTESTQADERAILNALEALDDESATGPTSDEDRRYREVWGLLPLSLDPVTPSAEVKQRLMAEIRGTRSVPEPLPFRAPADPVVATPQGATTSRWWLPLAAAIAAVAVGASLWFYTLSEQQLGQLASLEAALAASQQRVASLESTRGDLEEQLALVASPGMEVCPLAPMEHGFRDPARGVVFMDPRGGKWLLRASHLEPAPEGGVYTLWFLGADGEATRGGNLEAMKDAGYQLVAEGMPETMTGIAVTLETDEAIEQPAGPTVLFGDERFSI